MSRDHPNPSDADSPTGPTDSDLRYSGFTRRIEGKTEASAEPQDLAAADAGAETAAEAAPEARSRAPRHWGAGNRLRAFYLFAALVAVLLSAAFIAGRHFIRGAMRENLPQTDGSLIVYGLAAPVTVTRDARGIPHIHAGSMDDLIFAQGYVTAQDRLWQMDLMRRSVSGQLAEILGRSLLEHDRLERTLQLGTAADRAIAVLPADQLHWLKVYARGVNASIVAQHARLPIEFRLLRYRPALWTPRDSILVELAMFQELTTGFPEKLGREALAEHLSPQLIADLYPVGSWRDHYPGQPMPDLSAPQPAFDAAPLDSSQSQLRRPARKPGLPSASGRLRHGEGPALSAAGLLALDRALALFQAPCGECVAGSNAWAVSGARTASGKPLLSNDMHLTLSVPEIWYEADLEAPDPDLQGAFHAAGVTLPGTPFVIAGHNDHVAWGFTNLGADVQDLYIEHTRGTPSGAEYQTGDGTWSPIRYRTEIIHVRGGSDVILDVPLTRHGDTDTPIVSSIFPDLHSNTSTSSGPSSNFDAQRSISLRWTVYDPANLTDPFFAVDTASDWPSMLAAFAGWGGPPQNLIYADDQGHIGYHALGRIPIRGDIDNPSPLSPVPTDATAPDAASHEWAGYIPFDQLPQAFDPADGVLATANARVTPDGYRFPITLDWMAPYRTERIYRILEASQQKAVHPGPGTASGMAPDMGPDMGPDMDSGNGDSGNGNSDNGSESIPGDARASGHLLTAQDMLALQNDVHSSLDLVMAERLSYAIDHTAGPLKSDPRLRQAADLLRRWNGNVDANAAAPAIVNAARAAFWSMLLVPKLAPQAAAQLARGVDISHLKGLSADATRAANLWQVYQWGERDSVLEELITSTPARWLPPGYATWDDFLAAVVENGLHDAYAPRDLSRWQQGSAYPLDIENPIFAHVTHLARWLFGVPTGTGPRSESGDLTTIKQVGHSFGPSERFTADLGDPDRDTLNLVLGESGNPASPWYMDQFQSWLRGTTYPLPFTAAATQPTITHTLTLTPR